MTRYKRYEWWEPCAIRAEGYYYETEAKEDSNPQGFAVMANHDLPVEIRSAGGVAPCLYPALIHP
jgi:hypothetical protein